MTSDKKINLNPILAASAMVSVLISLFLFWQNKKATELLLIKTFEDCQKSQNTKIENDVCITEDGREFKKEKAVVQNKEEINDKTEFANQFFSLKYSTKSKLEEDKENNSVRILFLGESQKENTELSDGYSISISLLENNLTLKQIAQKEQKQALEVCRETSDITEYKSEKIEGYQYTANCLGNVQNIYTEKGNKKFRISLSWSGKEEYQKEVEEILSSLTFQE